MKIDLPAVGPGRVRTERVDHQYGTEILAAEILP